MKLINNKYYIAFFLICLIVGCSTKQVVWTDSILEPYQENVKIGRGSVVFYQLNEKFPNVVNIYINREYLGSLSKGNYIQSDVCPGEQIFYANISGIDQSYYGKQYMGNGFLMSEGNIVYLKVVNEGGAAVLRQMDAAQAQSEMSNLHRQNHTLSRVSQNQYCTNI